jgi:predicted SprT family Zn-dependent metalloprotease
MFNRMFIGRNGPDQLSFALIILSLLLSFVPWPYMFIITLTITGLAILRMFSRNIAQRQKENLFFMNLVNKIKSWYYRSKARSQQRKLYKIFKCPKCSQKLRVPRGKGKVSIKCSKCGQKMIRTT